MLTTVVTPALIGAAGAAANMGHVGGAIIFGRFKSASGPSLLTAGLAMAASGYFGLSLSGSLYVSIASAVCASLGVAIMLPTLLAWIIAICLRFFAGVVPVFGQARSSLAISVAMTPLHTNISYDGTVPPYIFIMIIDKNNQFY